MENIFGYTLTECQSLVRACNEPAFRGKQLFQWLYEKKINALDDCTNFSKKLREELNTRYTIDHGRILQVQKDSEDGTKKYLIEFEDGNCIESVLMQYQHGYSLCVSSQVGCNMGCAFCASTLGGKIRNLTAGEILSQIYLVEQDNQIRISNIVIMGIGEPLDNFDAVINFLEIVSQGWGIGQRHITLSTCGLVPKIDKLADKNLQINLAISLHSPFQDRREVLMPVARRYSIKELLKSCNNYFSKTKRRITFEYALIEEFNDRPEDVKELVSLLKGTGSHVNLIPLNAVTESCYKGSRNVNFFYTELKKSGVNCTIRRKIGENIDAACGQLRRKAENIQRR